jgi:hypothetical protein
LGKHYSAATHADAKSDADANSHANAESFANARANIDIVATARYIDNSISITFSDVRVSPCERESNFRSITNGHDQRAREQRFMNAVTHCVCQFVGMKSLAKRWWFWLLVVVVAAVVIVHMYLAMWVRDYVNRKLSEIPGYRAHVAAVTLHLWRGAYQIHNIDIVKTSGKVPVPFFAAPLVELSVQWRALFDGAWVGNIEFYRPKMNLVNAPSEENRQAPVDEPWAQKIKQLFPLKINRFAAHNGEIHYRDFSKQPSVDLVFDDVQMVGANLTNSKKLA